MDTKIRDRVKYRIPSKRAKRVGEGAHSGWVHEKEVYAIVGAALDVLNGVGHGFHEKPYENALVVEFRLRGIPFKQQPNYSIVYKQHKVGEFVPDLVAFDKVVVDAKNNCANHGSRARADA
jgi:GxxExxY protein